MPSADKENTPDQAQKGRVELWAWVQRGLIIKALSPSRWYQSWQGMVAAAKGEEKITQADASK